MLDRRRALPPLRRRSRPDSPDVWLSFRDSGDSVRSGCLLSSDTPSSGRRLPELPSCNSMVAESCAMGDGA